MRPRTFNGELGRSDNASASTSSDVLILGAGVPGMACALRLQVRGIKTRVLEAHGAVGGCAGYFRKHGFAFDVGATTLVDFGTGGVGGQFLEETGLAALDLEQLPGYRVWLPDRTLILHRDPRAWSVERLRAFGDTTAHRNFWAFLDRVSDVFWIATRRGVRMPVRSVSDVVHALKCVPIRGWPMARFLRWTMNDALAAHGLQHDVSLRTFLGMLIQDTVQSSLEDAPLINAALGVTMRGAGLARARGGYFGFWKTLTERYGTLGGDLRLAHRVERVERKGDGFVAHTKRGAFTAQRIISTLPIWNSAQLGLAEVEHALRPWTERERDHLGGAVVISVAARDEDVDHEEMTHHQLLVDYDAPLNDGNNMFVSISARGDTASAPIGQRAVTLSTHCDLGPWEGLDEVEYQREKARTRDKLMSIARRVYPNLGRDDARVWVGTPRTYERFTSRHRGAVGGLRSRLANTNQHAVPFDIGVRGYWQTGDTAWPGLGTVACVLASRHVADAVSATHRA
jgi:phytoene dehydrogenase-like protein